MLARMDPLYRPFFQHVWAICWPWLWWNLLRLTAWRRRTGRPVWVTVDRFGNVRIRIIGDAPKVSTLPAWQPRWARPLLASGLPQVAADMARRAGAPAAGLSPDMFRAVSGPSPDIRAAVRAPP